MFPEPTELLLIGCLIELTWIPKSKSNTSTPKTNSQTHWPREISRVMNGIIFCVVLTLAVSVLSIVLKWCQQERKKIQVKKESQQNRSRWWIWSRDAAKGLLTCLPLLHKKVWGKPDVFPRVEIWWIVEIRTGRLVYEQPPGLFTENMEKFIVDDNDTDSDTDAESDMSLETRSFLHRVEWSTAKDPKCSTRFDWCKRIFTRTLVIPRIWIRKEVVFFSWVWRMGQNCWADDVKIRRKQTSSLQIRKSMKQRWYTLVCRWGYDWKLLFAQ